MYAHLMYQNILHNKMMTNSFLVGKDLAHQFAIFKTNIQMKLPTMDYFKFNSNMSLKKEIKKFILLTVFHILILCSMIIYQNRK
jgi:hypothetical protein